MGKRPVEWMLDNIEMNDRFHLVHATHLTDSETVGIAKARRMWFYVQVRKGI